MTFKENDSLSYYTFDLFTQFPIVHGVFTRRGGVSEAPWDSLNVGSNVGDAHENVSENINRSFAALGRERSSMYDSWLVHGSDVLIAEEPADSPRDENRKADILLTNNPNVTLFMRYADCVPILLFDPRMHVIGLAHAGWRGTIIFTVEKAITAMASHFASSPEDIHAAIGPSICQNHYQVGGEVIAGVREAFGTRAEEYLQVQNGSTFFDLRRANRDLLTRSGVEQVTDADLCTACNLEDWYSHRGEGGRTGRFGVIFGLQYYE